MNNSKDSGSASKPDEKPKPEAKPVEKPSHSQSVDAIQKKHNVAGSSEADSEYKLPYAPDCYNTVWFETFIFH